ncbi:ATP-binding cassette domain-containing protein [Virgibacillus salarius]
MKKRKKVNSLHNIYFLIKIFNSPKFRIFCILLLFLTIVHALMPLINLELVKRLLNAIQVGDNLKTIIIVFSIMVVMQITQKVFVYLNNFATELFQLKLNNHVSELIMTSISTMKYEKLFSPLTIDKLYFLRTTSTAKIGSIFSSFLSIFSSFVTFCSMFIYLFNWIPYHTILVGISSIPIGVVQLYFNKKSFFLSQNINKHQREQFYLLHVATTPEYLKEIAQYSSMSYLVESHSNLFKNIFQPTKNLSKKQMIANILTSLLGVFAISYTQFKTVILAVQGKILIGTLMSILQALGNVFKGMQSLILSFGGFHSDWLYVNNLREFILSHEFDELEAPPQHIDMPISLSAKDLTYSVNGITIFKNLNFHFTAGSVIGIIGENGIGKTTLLEIIQGIKKEMSGELRFNNVLSTAISDVQRNNLSQTLHQNPSRYEFSLGENVGLSEIDKYKKSDNILRYIQQIDQESFVFNMNLQENSRLGEWYDESQQLSGGQWQRIALYRLFFKRSPIYLIDEPTNNLDENSLYLLEEMIKSVSKTSLVIMVSHDTSFLSEICTDIYSMTKNGLILQEQLEPQKV